MESQHELLSFHRPKSQKRPFNLEDMFARIEDAVDDYPPPLLHRLHACGLRTPFELIISSLLAARTPDEVAIFAANRLFARARAPRDIAALDLTELTELIEPVLYADQKARHIHEIAEIAWYKYEGRLPCRERVLKSLRGVGARCANQVLILACGQVKISVDSNIQRVTTRWGYIIPSSVSGAETQLCEKLPRELWITLNRVLEPFGKHVCTKERPRCSTCPVLMYCRQVGVEDAR